METETSTSIRDVPIPFVHRMTISDLISADQIRVARALLRWTAQDLADKAGVHIATIQRLEGAKGDVNNLSVGTYNAIVKAIKDAGIEFIHEIDRDRDGVLLYEAIGVKRVIADNRDIPF